MDAIPMKKKMQGCATRSANRTTRMLDLFAGVTVATFVAPITMIWVSTATGGGLQILAASHHTGVEWEPCRMLLGRKVSVAMALA